MKIILTCTTTIDRLNIFFYGIQSLLKQSIKPDLFIVNLSEENFLLNGNINVPNWLINDNIKLNITKDIGPYTKLIPTLDFADEEDLIITADDDILYHEKWLESLVENARAYPNNIICARARLMKKNIFKKWTNYNNWKIVKEECTSIDLLPLGVGGIVYKKKLLDLDFLLKSEFQKIAPNTDDLWFKMASYRLNVLVTVIPLIDYENMRIYHNKGLQNINFKIYPDTTSLHKKIFYFIINTFKNYLAINITQNDINWDNIYKFSIKCKIIDRFSSL